MSFFCLLECDRLDIVSKFGIVDEVMEDYNEVIESDDVYFGFGEGSSWEWWGVRMIKVVMVFFLICKYEVIEEYWIVDDVERVVVKMKVL